MIPLYTEEEFNQSKSNDKLPCQCEICSQNFYKMKRDIIKVMMGKRTGKYCSQKCKGLDKSKCVVIYCLNCNKKIKKRFNEFKKSNNHFCSNSCAAKYNNTHKTKGNRRSKLEQWLENELVKLYPDLEIFFNNKNIINSELDIYIPSLKLAFELNGIFHYEPIYGNEKLTQIKNNDNRKFQACLEQGIELCIIDTSQQKYFKEKSSKEFLNIIVNIINKSSLIS